MAGWADRLEFACRLLLNYSGCLGGQIEGDSRPNLGLARNSHYLTEKLYLRRGAVECMPGICHLQNFCAFLGHTMFWVLGKRNKETQPLTKEFLIGGVHVLHQEPVGPDRF